MWQQEVDELKCAHFVVRRNIGSNVFLTWSEIVWLVLYLCVTQFSRKCFQFFIKNKFRRYIYYIYAFFWHHYWWTIAIYLDTNKCRGLVKWLMNSIFRTNIFKLFFQLLLWYIYNKYSFYRKKMAYHNWRWFWIRYGIFQLWRRHECINSSTEI